jgi:hypothetical protein
MKKTRHDGDCAIYFMRHKDMKTEEGLCTCGYTFYYRTDRYEPKRDEHDRRCTIFEESENKRKSGICTCGYGHQKKFRGIDYFPFMYSKEKLENMGHKRINKPIAKLLKELLKK